MFRLALLFSALLIVPHSAAAQQTRSSQGKPQAAPAPAAVPHDSVRGAIRVIDVRKRTVEVSTGVGYALRVVPLQVPASASIKDRKGGQLANIALADLKLGDVVRARFGGYAAPFVVYTIERIGRMTTGVDSTP